MRPAPPPLAAALVAAAVAAAVAATVAHPAAAAGQEARAVAVGDTVRVGDRVPVSVRLVLDPGHSAVFPDTVPVGVDGDVENVSRLRAQVDTLADGRVQATAVYTVSPWRAGAIELPALPVELRSPGRDPRTVRVPLPGLDVVSVLPSAPAEAEPRPAKGVLGPSWPWWSLPLLVLLLLGAAALAAWWVRRRRRHAPPPALPAVPPRERALAKLAEARVSGLAERGEWRELYTRITAALREYLHAIEPDWGEDLTTTELLARVRAGAGLEASSSLGALLRPADQVKFARREPTPAEALAELDAAWRWVAAFDRPAPAREAAA